MQLIHVFSKFHIDCHLRKGTGPSQMVTVMLSPWRRAPRARALTPPSEGAQGSPGPQPSAPAARSAAQPARPWPRPAWSPCEAGPPHRAASGGRSRAPYLILGLVVRDGEAVGDFHRVLVHGPCGRAARLGERPGGGGLLAPRLAAGGAGRRLLPSSVPMTRAAPSLRRSKLSTMEASTTGCSRTTRPPGKGPESAVDSGAAGGAGVVVGGGAAVGGAFPAGAAGAAVGLCAGAAAGAAGAGAGAVAAILQERGGGGSAPAIIG